MSRNSGKDAKDAKDTESVVNVGSDRRLQERRVRLEGKEFDRHLQRSLEKLPDLANRIAPREPEDLEAFAREFMAEKKLREQRIAKQVRSGEQRPSPQSEPLPGDTRD